MARNQDLSKLRYKQTQHPNLAPKRYYRYANPNHLVSIRKVKGTKCNSARSVIRNGVSQGTPFEHTEHQMDRHFQNGEVCVASA